MIKSQLLFQILIAFGAFQAFFIASVFLTQRNGHKAKRIISLLLFIEGVTLIERLLAETGLIEAIPHLIGVSYPLSFLKPPALLFAGLAIIDRRFRFKRIHLLHLIPFLIILAFNAPIYAQSAEFKLEMVRNFISSVPGYGDFNFYLYLSFYGHIGTYVAVTVLKIQNYKRHIKNNRPANWYLVVLKLYSSFLIISMLYFLVLPSGLLEIPMFNITTMLIMTFVIQSIAYSFFVGADIFNNSNAPVLQDIDQRLQDEQRIRYILEKEKSYLKSDLTLGEFAKSAGMTSKYTSDLVNQTFGCSFKELINGYRVEEAKNIMHSGTESQMIQIALESGFNNKVSFYRSFKKHTGKSPSDYFKGVTNHH